MRFSIFDGIRGHLLIGMLVAHLGFSEGLGALLMFHHQKILRLYDAEFFVTIAGLLIGVLVARKAGDPGYFNSFVRRRLGTIYRYYLASAVPVLLLTVFPNGQFAGMTTLAETLFGIVTLQQGGGYSDILPIYFYSFLVLGILYPIGKRFGHLAMGLASACLYGVSQVYLSKGMLGLSDGFVVFNVAAWQFLFVVSFLIGLNSRSVLGWLKGLSNWQGLILFAICVAIFALSRVVLPDTFELYNGRFSGNGLRMHLHPLYLIAIVSVVVGFSLVLANPPRILKPVHAILVWYFSLGFLQTVGRYSIQMFVLHVYMMALFRQLAPSLTAQGDMVLAIMMIVAFILAPVSYEALKARRSSVA